MTASLPPIEGTAERSQALLGLVTRIIGGLVGVALVVLLTRHLTVEEFGIASYALTLGNLVRVLIGFGGNDWATAELARSPSTAPRTLSALLCLRTVAAWGCASLLGGFLWWSEHGETRWILLAICPFLLASALKSGDPVFHVRQRVAEPLIVRVLGQLALFFVLLFLASRDQLSIAVVVILAAATPAFSQTVTFLRSLRWQRPAGSWSLREAREFLGGAYPLAFATVFGLLTFHLDTVMLRHLRGAHDTGVYNLGFRLFAFSLTLPAVVLGPLLPVLARDAGQRIPLFRKWLFRTAAASLLGAGLAFPLAGLVVELLDPEDRYQESVQVLRLLAFAFVGHAVSTLGGMTLIAAKAASAWAWVTALGFCANVVANAWWIPRQGASGAAAATCVTELFGALLVVSWVMIRRRQVESR